MAKRVAVVVPHHTDIFSEYEQISLNSLEKYLSEYPIFYVCPESIRGFNRYRTVKFADKYFSSIAYHNYLRLKPLFWEKFLDYEYLLIYELDSIVLSSNLEYFCELGYDYIGAPWISFENGKPKAFGGAANSGLSLRNVNSALSVLCSKRRYVSPGEYWHEVSKNKQGTELIRPALAAVSKIFRSRNNINWFIRQFMFSKKRNWAPHEDKFWVHYAKTFWPEFTLAPPEIALSFSFEGPFAYCFSQNHNSLPFGAHKWNYHTDDIPVWMSYLGD